MDQCLTISRRKTLKKKFRGRNQAQNCFYFVTTSRDKAHGKKLGTQIGSEIMVFAIFLDIAQDCSLGQCLTSSRTETSKKNNKKTTTTTTKICGQNDLFYSNVVWH